MTEVPVHAATPPSHSRKAAARTTAATVARGPKKSPVSDRTTERVSN